VRIAAEEEGLATCCSQPSFTMTTILTPRGVAIEPFYAGEIGLLDRP
jgi:hypothetical protein